MSGNTAAVLLVDAANVVGSRPDGWWRDRAGAAERLIALIEAALQAGRLEGPVVVVLEGRARLARAPEERPETEPGGGPLAEPEATAGSTAQLAVARASGSGDDLIVEIASETAAEGRRVTVVTADRELMARVGTHGAEIESPGRFLRRL